MNKEFDLSNVKTCVNADDVCIGDYGVFADTIGELKLYFNDKTRIGTVQEIRDEQCAYRFVGKRNEYMDCCDWILFYPLEGAK